MISSLLIIIGLAGVLGMTWLFPLLATIVWRKSRYTNSSESLSMSSFLKYGTLQVGSEASPHNDQVAPYSLAILTPAHNEEAILSKTLTSFAAAIKRAQQVFPGISIEVVVGADGCSDKTALIADAFGATVIESSQSNGKWATLNKLISLVNTRPEIPEWVVLADAGVQWDPEFLVRILPRCGIPHVVGVCPTYRNPSAGKIESLLWAIERHLKSLEGITGGPVSMHGATVLYKLVDLSRALRSLPRANWLNDDVVIPLALRSQDPEARILYTTDLGVYDTPSDKGAEKVAQKEFGRRRRMVLGNIQWIRGMLPTVWRRNAIAGVIAMRRVFRLLWAYWGLMIVGASTLLIMEKIMPEFSLIKVVGLIIFTVVLAYQFVKPLRGIIEAACASLLTPYLYFSPSAVQRAVWK